MNTLEPGKAVYVDPNAAVEFSNPFRINWRCPKCKHMNGCAVAQQGQISKCFNCSADVKLTLNVSVIAVEVVVVQP